MDDADFAALRKEAQLANDDLRFLREEADNFYGEIQKQQQAAQKEAAREAVKVLQENIPSGRTRCITTSEGTPLRKVCPRTRSIVSSTLWSFRY